MSSLFINDVINEDAESRTQWTTYGLTQIGIGLIADKGLGKASLVTKGVKGSDGASTLAKGLTLIKELKQASDILQSFKKDVSYAFAGGNNIRSRFDISDFKQTEEKLSTHQFAKGENSSGGNNPVDENHTPPFSNREIISNLQHTEKFRGNVLKHILEGEINWRGDAMGYHTEVLENTPGKIISGTEEVVNDQGIYKARVEVNGTPKTGNRGFSIFPPKDWSPQKIVDNINEAYNNTYYVTTPMLSVFIFVQQGFFAICCIS
ncbi:EndoU domain-containing protein [Bacillus pseudomycoides]|uniref:EndoU domain-containing protein n=1 Tax=Bacillus pseudomycoides TaxID=64104 RepID=UPI002693218D|nr:EndoU domain-containing protein [Bacillus pseudomycoides]